jgi:hypothetical protein
VEDHRAIETLVRQLARECEHHQGPVGKCPCGGLLRGVAHPPVWLEGMVELVEREYRPGRPRSWRGK